MRRRSLLSVAGSFLAVVPGCQTSRFTDETPTQTPTDSPVPNKPGTVDNHRITAVEVVSHDAERRTKDARATWALTVTLRLLPQESSNRTPSAIGVFFLYYDGEDRQVYETYEQLAANTGRTPRTVTLESDFDADAAGVDTFDHYRIDIVHG